jgi:hypothetical protein
MTQILNSIAPKISKIEEVQLRDIWPDEARDFTPWLVTEAGIGNLSQAIGVDIINPTAESAVGSFSVDIIAETDDGKTVIIENQLEQTDHDHLGKLMTYTSGKNATVSIWIVKQARDEHKSAVEWLNNHTDEHVNIFLVEIKAIKIDTSKPALLFNVVESPNSWTKETKKNSVSTEVSDNKMRQREFFEDLIDYARENNSIVPSWQAPRAQHWLNIAIGTSKAHLAITLNSKTQKIGVEYSIKNGDSDYDVILRQKTNIDEKISDLVWMELPNKNASRVIKYLDYDFADENDRPEAIKATVELVDEFYNVFWGKL